MGNQAKRARSRKGIGPEILDGYYARFKDECERIRALWQINDWDFFFENADIVENHPSEKTLAEATMDHRARSAVVALNRSWDKELDDVTITDSAREEMVHVLIGELTCLLMERYVTQAECDAAVEAVTKRLKRILP